MCDNLERLNAIGLARVISEYDLGDRQTDVTLCLRRFQQVQLLHCDGEACFSFRDDRDWREGHGEGVPWCCLPYPLKRLDLTVKHAPETTSPQNGMEKSTFHSESTSFPRSVPPLGIGRWTVPLQNGWRCIRWRI